MIKPLFQEILYRDPSLVFAQFANQEGSVLLESAQRMPGCGRYSFIGVDPFLKLISKNGRISLNNTEQNGDPLQVLEELLARFVCENHDDLPPFQGGVMGFFSYDLYQHLETVASSQQDDMQFPDMALGFYDVVIAFDHELQKAWIFSNGFSMTEKPKRAEYAQQRLEEFLAKMEMQHESQMSHYPIAIQANFTKKTYCEAVSKVKEYILAGDIFEANISQRFRAEVSQDFESFGLYRQLRVVNPATFAAYVRLGDTIVVSASPERFLKLQNHQVETRPIKGTRKRGKTVAEDAELADDLLANAKDRAENIMIVDLLRNDLSRVCEDYSVEVPQLCGLETYPSVHHLVSVVKGKLRPEFNAIDLLRATFPGGSITGAPKVRAMEIIAEIEPTRRGPYCGSVGYIGFNGDMDTSITIRTFALKNNVITFQAGGAVVLDSNPVHEYEETLTKAHALQRALQAMSKKSVETV